MGEEFTHTDEIGEHLGLAVGQPQQVRTDEHMTVQKIKKFDRDGRRVSAQRLRAAARVLRGALADLAPIDIAIGPPYTSASAAVLDVSPDDHVRDADALNDLYLRSRDGLIAAGLCLPPAEVSFWGHMSGGYGLIDTDTPASAQRSDRLASHLSRGLRPGHHIAATLASVWLVMERQDPVANRYSFTRVCEIPLGRAEGAAE